MTQYTYQLLEGDGDDGAGNPCMILTRYETDDLLDVIRSSFVMHHDSIVRVDDTRPHVETHLHFRAPVESYDDFLAALQSLDCPAHLTTLQRAELYFGLSQSPEPP